MVSLYTKCNKSAIPDIENVYLTSRRTWVSIDVSVPDGPMSGFEVPAQLDPAALRFLSAEKKLGREMT